MLSVVVQSLSCAWLFVTLMDCPPGFPVLHQLPQPAHTCIHGVGDAIQPSHSLLSPSPARIRVFSNESTLCIRWPKCWSFSFSMSFQWIFRVDFLQDWLVWSPWCPRDSQESSPTPQDERKWKWSCSVVSDSVTPWLVGSPCSPRDSPESSPTPQFKSINSSALSFLYSPTLTSIHDYWKNHSFENTNLCWQIANIHWIIEKAREFQQTYLLPFHWVC